MGTICLSKRTSEQSAVTSRHRASDSLGQKVGSLDRVTGCCAETMKKLILIFLLLCFWSGEALAVAPVGERFEGHSQPVTTEQWRQDLQTLAKELSNRHKNAFHTVSREAFARAIAELDAAIPNRQASEIIIGLQQILALVGDSHTFLTNFPPPTFHRFPLAVYWFGNQLHVVATSADYRRALGARVLRIGEWSVAEVAAKLKPVISTDKEYWTRHLSAYYLPYAEILYARGILPAEGGGRWTFEDAEGKPFSIELQAKAQDEKIEWLVAAKETPLCRQRVGERFWFTPLPDGQTVYVNLRGYPDSNDFKRTADDLLKWIDAAKPKRLVLDVRHNEGGDMKKGRYLLAGLKKRKGFDTAGSLYVIIGRATQSAAMVNAIDFRKELNAILVGEPTGGKPNCYSENEFFLLPNSKLRISHSTQYYRFQEAETPALMPDQLIEPTWEAYQAGRDAALEWILAGREPQSPVRERNLSRHAAADRDPAWSPDGNRIAFATDRDGNFEIYLMNADGTGQTRLTSHPAADRNPAWSRDGKQIIFQSNRDGNEEIYLMNADGSQPTRLTHHTGDDLFPDLSPDGTKITFTSNRQGNLDIFVMNANGTNPTALTHQAQRDAWSRWSPDGQRLVFFSRRDSNDDNDEIYVMNADGSNIRRLTDNRGHDFCPAWSADGKQLAFLSIREDGQVYVYRMNADGSAKERITNRPDRVSTPTWSPDGRRIAFSSQRDGNFEVYVAELAGAQNER